jgi:hypothetical protein
MPDKMAWLITPFSNAEPIARDPTTDNTLANHPDRDWGLEALS